MTFGTLEILATILIVFSFIKLAIVLTYPQVWLNFAKKFYIKPEVTSTVASILAATVLYFLVNSGITIVQILAITLFIALVVTVGIAKYAEKILSWASNQDLKTIFYNSWPSTVIWIALLGWGIKAIFIS